MILYLAYPGGPIVITKVLYREKRQTSQNQSGVIVRKTLPAIAPLKMEERKGGVNQGIQILEKARKQILP